MQNVLKSVGAFFAVTIVSAAAMAWPTVGDAVNYDLTMQANGQTISGEMNLQVQSIDPATDSVAMQTIINVAGQSRAENSTARLSEFSNLASSVAYVVANCASSGGQTEAVATASGNFQACKISTRNGTQVGFAWIADVKFGWVKQDISDSANGIRTIILFRNQN